MAALYAYEHLAADGKFMFDICERPPSQMVNLPERTEWFTVTHPNGRQIYISGTDRYDYTQQQRIQTCSERWDEPQGKLVRPPWELTLRYTMPQDLETLLYYNGFKVVARYAAYDGTLATAEKPPGVFICEKRLENDQT